MEVAPCDSTVEEQNHFIGLQGRDLVTRGNDWWLLSYCWSLLRRTSCSTKPTSGCMESPSRCIPVACLQGRRSAPGIFPPGNFSQLLSLWRDLLVFSLIAQNTLRCHWLNFSTLQVKDLFVSIVVLIRE